MKRVTGLGGVFFKTENPQKLKDWYSKHLGMEMGPYGHTFFWHPMDEPSYRARTEWSLFQADTDYFKPSSKPFMLNYRVENLEGLLEILKAEGVQVVGEIEVYDYGKFGWILDPEGNKIELWEPVDTALNKFEGIED